MNATADGGLIFRWEPPRRRAGMIVACVVGSALLHAFGFYVFQTIYPPTVALLPPPARVSVISPITEEGRLLLRWVEAEDPALAGTTQRPPETRIIPAPRVAHEPSFRRHELPLKQIPPASTSLTVEANPPAPVPTAQPGRSSPLPLSATRIAFDEEANGRAVRLPPLQFSRSIAETPRAAQFRIAISATGDVPYALLAESSGDAALDEQARQALARCRFAPNESSQLTWTLATVEWGNDIAAASAATPAASP